MVVADRMVGLVGPKTVTQRCHGFRSVSVIHYSKNQVQSGGYKVSFILTN